MESSGHATHSAATEADFGGVLLPTQIIAGSARGRLDLTPAQLLMLAVLEDAVICYSWRNDARPQHRRHAYQAEQWLRSSSTSDLFCFRSICTHLDLDAATVRRRILETSPREDGRRRRRSHRVRSGGPTTDDERARRRAAALALGGSRIARVGRIVRAPLSFVTDVGRRIQRLVARLGGDRPSPGVLGAV